MLDGRAHACTSERHWGVSHFLDRVEVRTGDKERVFEASNDGQAERIVSVLDVDAERFIVSRETPTEVPQSYLVEGGSRTQLTHNVDYTPQMTNAPRRRFAVERPDGFRFLVNVTLPPERLRVFAGEPHG